MTPGDLLVSKLKQIAAAAAELPEGAVVTVEWVDAPTDLLLAVALLRGGHLRSVRLVGGGNVEQAEWTWRRLSVRAHRRTKGRVKLALVKP